jgi:hypothetical protein
MIPVLIRRRIVDALALIFAGAATLFGLVWLFWILWTTLQQGIGALNVDLFTEMTPPPGATGGLLNAFYGSAMMILLAIAIGAPVGVAAGTYLAEHGRYSRLASVVSFLNDVLLSAPSIVIGLFVYELVVRRAGHFSGYAGALALAMILLPGPRPDARGGVRARHPAKEGHVANPLQGRVDRHPDRRPAWRRTDRRRDRATAVHGAQQPVLDLEPQRTAGQCSGGHLPICDEPL